MRRKPHPVEAYELSLFDNAGMFVVMKIVPRQSKEREEYATFPEAVKAATGWKDAYGRGAMIYAVTDAGRHTYVPHDQWETYLERWEQRTQHSEGLRVLAEQGQTTHPAVSTPVRARLRIHGKVAAPDRHTRAPRDVLPECRNTRRNQS